MNGKIYEFQAVIEPVPDQGGAYIRFPYDIRKEFGKGRVKVLATFDGVPYSGSIVNMGLKNEDGSVCDILRIQKDVRQKVRKLPGDRVLSPLGKQIPAQWRKKPHCKDETGKGYGKSEHRRNDVFRRTSQCAWVV